MTERATRLLFAATIFLAAALVFLVQPMVARQLLPTFGGTPGVWNATVTFFQLALLLGYAYAHLSLRWLGVRRQSIVQVALAVVALAFVPFALRTGVEPPGGVPPAVWIALLLAAAVGVPYVAVAAASPMLQRWYAELGAAESDQPWFLYVASNAGSLVGLLAFPILLEPRLATSGQEWLWAGAFAAWIALLVACVVVVRRRAATEEAVDLDSANTIAASSEVDHPSLARRIRWVLVAALPVALMLGVTTYVTTDVASAPLLWVVPLALYLASFMVTFGRRWRIGPRAAGWATGASTILLVLVEVDRIDVGELERFGAHVLATTCASVLCHAVLYADRPAARHLTGFYLLLSTGGAIGGMLVSLAAPLLLDDVYEYPLLLALAMFLRPAPRRSPDAPLARAGVNLGELAIAAVLLLVLAGSAANERDLAAQFDGTAWLVVIVAGSLLLLTRRAGAALLVTGVLALVAFAAPGDSIVRDRSFFGTLRVEDRNGMRRLLHGTTLHGGQLLSLDDARTPTTYYSTPGPLGDAMGQLQVDEPFVEVGVVGLGTGGLLAHARLWQRFTFYEIDPDVIEVATNPKLFTYVSGADVQVDIVEGDARLRLDESEDARYDLLVLDAYSSDAVPVHLLTVEALRLYQRRLADDGVLLLHVSSRHLQLEPIVSAAAAQLDLHAIGRTHTPTAAERVQLRATSSNWIAVARDPQRLERLAQAGWEPLEDARPEDAWTDEFSNVVETIRWWPDWLR